MGGGAEMKVYALVLYTEFNGYKIEDIFDGREKAQTRLDSYEEKYKADLEIEEYEVF